MSSSSSQKLQLQDASLISISVDREGSTALLKFVHETGEAQSLELSGLKAFRCEDMTIQNVVSRGLIASRKEIAAPDVEQWLKWVTSLSDTSSWLTEAKVKEWAIACDLGSLELVLLEPSAGALIVAVCEQVLIEP